MVESVLTSRFKSYLACSLAITRSASGCMRAGPRMRAGCACMYADTSMHVQIISCYSILMQNKSSEGRRRLQLLLDLNPCIILLPQSLPPSLSTPAPPPCIAPVSPSAGPQQGRGQEGIPLGPRRRLGSPSCWTLARGGWCWRASEGGHTPQSQEPMGDRQGSKVRGISYCMICDSLNGHASYLYIAPSDAELLGSMATRLAVVERELLASKREIVMKV